MPRQPKNVREKGHFICPGHMPCKEPLPKSAITEWLELEAPSNLISTIENVDGHLKTVTRKLAPEGKSNREWIAREFARIKKANKNSEYECSISYSKNERFACICKRHKDKQK